MEKKSTNVGSVLYRRRRRKGCPNGGKAHQEERRPARPIREKAQEGEKRLRRIEEKKAAYSVKGEAQQKEWRRSSWEDLRKRAE